MNTSPTPKQKIDQARQLLAHRVCPVCEEPFDVEPGKSGRPPVYCSPHCKAAARNDPRTAIRRWCPTCNTPFTFDSTTRLGSPPTYCSERCALKSSSISRFIRMQRCRRPGCSNTIPDDTAKFCSTECMDGWVEDTYGPQGRLCCLPGCNQPAKWNRAALRTPQGYCCQQHRSEDLDIDRFQLARTLANEAATDTAAKRRKKAHRRAKADRSGQLLIQNGGPYAIAHIDKRRWGMYPTPILTEILKMGWADEEEFFTTEDSIPPAVHAKLAGSDIARPTVATNWIMVRRLNETDGFLLQPDDDAPDDDHYTAMAEAIKQEYQSETKDPPYYTKYLNRHA